jgi:hypothetical protein
LIELIIVLLSMMRAAAAVCHPELIHHRGRGDQMLIALANRAASAGISGTMRMMMTGEENCKIDLNRRIRQMFTFDYEAM